MIAAASRLQAAIKPDLVLKRPLKSLQRPDLSQPLQLFVSHLVTHLAEPSSAVRAGALSLRSAPKRQRYRRLLQPDAGPE